MPYTPPSSRSSPRWPAAVASSSSTVLTSSDVHQYRPFPLRASPVSSISSLPSPPASPPRSTSPSLPPTSSAGPSTIVFPGPLPRRIAASVSGRSLSPSGCPSSPGLKLDMSTVYGPPPDSPTHERVASLPLPTPPPMLRKKSGEVVKPALRSRSRSEFSVSAPSTPAEGKSVAFRKGGELEDVRFFLGGQKPLAVSRGGSPQETETEEESESYPFPSLTPAQPDRLSLHVADFPRLLSSSSSSLFPVPPTTHVLLENVSLSPSSDALTGTILVRNLSYHKSVVARFTYDFWTVVSEVLASYTETLPSLPASRFRATEKGTEKAGKDSWDRWTFTIRLGDLARVAEKTLLLCVRFRAESGEEFWDSNVDGRNYRFEFRRVAPSTAARGRDTGKKWTSMVADRLRVAARSGTGRRQQEEDDLDSSDSGVMLAPRRRAPLGGSNKPPVFVARYSLPAASTSFSSPTTPIAATPSLTTSPSTIAHTPTHRVSPEPTWRRASAAGLGFGHVQSKSASEDIRPPRRHARRMSCEVLTAAKPAAGVRAGQEAKGWEEIGKSPEPPAPVSLPSAPLLPRKQPLPAPAHTHHSTEAPLPSPSLTPQSASPPLSYSSDSSPPFPLSPVSVPQSYEDFVARYCFFEGAGHVTGLGVDMGAGGGGGGREWVEGMMAGGHTPPAPRAGGGGGGYFEGARMGASTLGLEFDGDGAGRGVGGRREEGAEGSGDAQRWMAIMG